MTPLTLKLDGDRHVVVTRRFAAPPEKVYRAHLEPELLQQWMLGPEGWTMPKCEHDARPGGTFRYEWTDGGEGSFIATGEFIELVPPTKIVHIERYHLPELPGPTPDCRVETYFEADGEGTLLTARMTMPDAESREAMLATGMEEGMEASYERVDRVLGHG